jgi:hypothetical protein
LELNRFTDEQVELAIGVITGIAAEVANSVAGDDTETAFRRDEYACLRRDIDDEQLGVKTQTLEGYDQAIKENVQLIALVEKLRETRAFAGFSRIQSNEGADLELRKSALWRDPPQAPARWLPAYKVFGEGIYLELDEAKLQVWERHLDVIARIAPLASHYEELRGRRSLRDLSITPRFVLLHTLSHLLMNELVFNCGYSSAALRERLYVSSTPGSTMAGLLIYTAAGDSDGTMGGLVRMGKPGLLDQVLVNALANASWCSSDPVCMELGGSGGQGPDSCNLAACHSCGLVPETSCEQFNRFLDRWLVVGAPTNPRIGFFGQAMAEIA